MRNYTFITNVINRRARLPRINATVLRSPDERTTNIHTRIYKVYVVYLQTTLCVPPSPCLYNKTSYRAGTTSNQFARTFHGGHRMLFRISFPVFSVKNKVCGPPRADNFVAAVLHDFERAAETTMTSVWCSGLVC